MLNKRIDRVTVYGAILVAVAMLLPAPGALADNYEWDPGSTNWNASTSWDNLSNPIDAVFDDGTVPDGTNDAATIMVGPAAQLTSFRALGNLTLTGGGKLFMNTFTLNLNPGPGTTGTTTVTGGGSTLNVEQGFLDTDVLNLNTNGEIDIRGGTLQMDVNGSFASSGLVEGFGFVEKGGSLNLINNGIIRATGGTLTIERAGGTSNFDWDGNGTSSTLQVFSGATMRITIPTSDDYSRLIDLNGGTLDITNTWGIDSGAIIDMDGNNTISGAGWDMSSGSVINVNSGVNTISSSSFTVNSQIRVDPGAILNISSPNKILNAGSPYLVNGAMNLNGNATINGVLVLGSGQMSTLGGGTKTYTGTTAINVDTLDWDGSSHTVAAGATLDINSDTIDVGDNRFNGQTISLLSSSTLDVNVVANEWINEGTINMGGATIAGDKLSVGTNLAGNVNANTGTNNIGASFDVDAFGAVSVGSGATLNLNAASRFESGANITISGTLVNDSGLTIAGPDPIVGSGTIRNNGNWVFSGSTTINTTGTDLDGNQGGGSTTTINAGNTVTINSKVIETDANNDYTGTINLNSSTLNINTINPVELGGTINITDSGTNPVLGGTGYTILNNGEIRVNGAANIDAPTTIQSGGEIRNITNGSVLRTNDLVTLAGGNIEEDFASTYQPVGSINVTGVSSINVTTFDWDVAGVTDILNGRTLTLNVATIDVGNNQFDAANINVDGTLVVNNTTNVWTIGTNANLNLISGTVNGAGLEVGGGLNNSNANVNVSGGASSSFNGPLFDLVDADVSVAGNSVFNVNSDQMNISANTTINVAAGSNFRFAGGGDAAISGGTYTGAGVVGITGGVGDTTTILADTTIDTATLDWDGNGGNFTVNPNVTFTINSDDMTGNAYNTGTITIGVSGEIAVNTTGPWTLGSTAALGMGANSRLSGSQVIVAGPITDLGGGGVPVIAAPVQFNLTGSLNVPAGNAVDLNGVTTFNGGTITGAGGIRQNANFTVLADTSLDIDNFNWDFGAALTHTINSGAIFKLNVGVTGGFNDTLNIQDNASLLINGSNQASWTNGGTINLGGFPGSNSPAALIGGSDAVINLGLIKGNGTFGVDVTNGNSGRIEPGTSPGTLRFGGTLNLQSGGTLEIEINSTGAAGVHYDHVLVVGTITAGGVLDFVLGGGYTPALGDEFNFLQMVSAAPINGTFDQITNVVQAGSLGLAVRYGYDANQIDMRVSIRGDTDFDNDVDTSDLTAAIIGFNGAGGSGNTWVKGDFDGDGDTDTSDLTTAIVNFTGASAANPNVPDLVYDPATGNVTIDADGADVISFSLQGGPFNAADFSELPAGLTDNIASQIGWTSFNLFSGLTGTADLGAILPAGLDQAGLEAALTTASYGLALAGGGGGGRLDLIIPEPGSVVLMLIAGTTLFRRRRLA